jgi:hypothetical protein
MEDDVGEGEAGTSVGLALIQYGKGDVGVELCCGNDLNGRCVGSIAEVDAIGQDIRNALSADWQRRRCNRRLD